MEQGQYMILPRSYPTHTVNVTKRCWNKWWDFKDFEPDFLWVNYKNMVIKFGKVSDGVGELGVFFHTPIILNKMLSLLLKLHVLCTTFLANVVASFLRTRWCTTWKGPIGLGLKGNRESSHIRDEFASYFMYSTGQVSWQVETVDYFTLWELFSVIALNFL